MIVAQHGAFPLQEEGPVRTAYNLTLNLADAGRVREGRVLGEETLERRRRVLVRVPHLRTAGTAPTAEPTSRASQAGLFKALFSRRSGN